MMQVKPFIPKDDNDLPDYYGIFIKFNTGRTLSLDVASHHILKETGVVELVTHDDEWFIFPLVSIEHMKFDKQFSKVVSINQKDRKTA